MNRKVKTAMRIAEEQSFQKSIRKRTNPATVRATQVIPTAQNYVVAVLNELRHQATKDTMEDKVNVDRNDFNKPNKKWKSNQDTFTYHYGVANQKMGEEIVNENEDNIVVKNGKMTFKGTGINAFALLGLHNAGVI